jgi:hypothetical protein
VRMVPLKDGEANQAHSCVKGRFALDATHAIRPHPMIPAGSPSPGGKCRDEATVPRSSSASAQVWP